MKGMGLVNFILLLLDFTLWKLIFQLQKIKSQRDFRQRRIKIEVKVEVAIEVEKVCKQN